MCSSAPTLTNKPGQGVFLGDGKNKSPEQQINDLKGRLVTAKDVLVVTAAVWL